jgi:hypothetical protein
MAKGIPSDHQPCQLTKNDRSYRSDVGDRDSARNVCHFNQLTWLTARENFINSAAMIAGDRIWFHKLKHLA